MIPVCCLVRRKDDLHGGLLWVRISNEARVLSDEAADRTLIERVNWVGLGGVGGGEV